jgi:hypothetical protein
MKMARDIVETAAEYLSDDPARWGKLASNIQWRRLQLLLLREILVELRKVNARAWGQEEAREQETRAK